MARQRPPRLIPHYEAVPRAVYPQHYQPQAVGHPLPQQIPHHSHRAFSASRIVLRLFCTVAIAIRCAFLSQKSITLVLQSG